LIFFHGLRGDHFVELRIGGSSRCPRLANM
jgi:hypothetical protein